MKVKMKRIMGLFLALAVSIGCLSLNPIDSYAEENTFNINDGSVNITQSGTYTIEGTGHATPNTISVTGNDITVTITLKNVNIDVSNQTYNSAFLAKGYGQSNVQLTIILQGTNSLKSGEERAGLTWNNHNNSSTLEIEGDGSLTATGGKNGAGIGSSWNHNGGTRNITITGGTVIATGGDGAAGIGGDRGNSAENIKITGGTVTATGGGGAAGIGGGGSDSGKNITIAGGTVTATGGYDGAGIGGGRQGGSGENITITGGTVIATGVGYAAGIGGGAGGSGKKITITGGSVTATGRYMAAGIGGGERGSGENIKITGGSVTATGEEDGIGGGSWSLTKNFTITGGSVKVNGFGATPTDGNGHSVYLAKLENQDGVNEVTVDSGTGNAKTFTRAGNHSGGDTAFYLYLTEKDHDLVTSKGKYKAKWNGNTNAFTTKFNPNDVRSMSVTSQPSKLTYTEDDKLDLSGLVVTLTDGQGFTRDVTPAQFEANGIKATPENGKKLELTDGGNPVKLKRGNLAAETTNALQVKQRVFDPSSGSSAGMNDDAPATLDNGELNIQIDIAESDSKPGYAGDGAGNANAGSAPEVKQSDAAVKQSADTLALAQAQADSAARKLADARKSQHEAPAPKLQHEKRIGMIPKTDKSASFAGLIALYAGLIAVLGFSIAGLAILLKKKMTEENNK